jgi:DNA-binding response OmpR family regulator
MRQTVHLVVALLIVAAVTFTLVQIGANATTAGFGYLVTILGVAVATNLTTSLVSSVVATLIDVDRRKVVQGEREIRLTPTEFAILDLLAHHAGRPVSFDEIIATVWKGAPGTSNDAVRVHVGALRRKLEPDPSNPQYLVTEPWIGYRFIAEPV